MPILVLFSWRVHLHQTQFEWAEYPSGLGDTRYYTKLGSDDFYQGNLRYKGQADGLYRRTINPLVRADEKMLKVAKEEQGRVFIYTDQSHVNLLPNQPGKRVYVKSAEDRYIEFGERKFWPEYQPPRLTPAP